MITVYCKCGELLKEADVWRQHLESCSVLKDSLGMQMHREPSVDIRYPDLAPAQAHEVMMARHAGIPVTELPVRASLNRGANSVAVALHDHTFSWALVIMKLAKTDDDLRGALTRCWQGGPQAQKAFVAMLRCVGESEFGNVVHDFAVG